MSGKEIKNTRGEISIQEINDSFVAKKDLLRKQKIWRTKPKGRRIPTVKSKKDYWRYSQVKEPI